MKFEVVEGVGEWIVRRDGVELARFGDQLEALAAIGARLRESDEVKNRYSVAMRFQARA